MPEERIVHVALPGGYNPGMILRQTPGGRGFWKSMQFHPGATEFVADWLAVLDEVTPFIETRIPRERRILFVTEPDGCKHYPASYLNNYGTVVSPTELRGYRGRHLRRQTALPWWIGAGNFFDRTLETVTPYDGLAAMPPPEKTHALSVICSTHNLMPMHKQRIEFVKAIKAYFGDDLHWYGRGVRSMQDKGEAILPYRYHIALENSKISHFWTEKLADCYLGYAFPLYSGCANVGDYFSREAFEPIDIGDPEGAIATIKSVLDRDPWRDHLSALEAARRKVLEDYNFFNVCAGIITELSAAQPETAPLLPAAETIYPVPPPFRERLKTWERRYRRRARAELEKLGLVAPKKNKWKKYAETAVPEEKT